MRSFSGITGIIVFSVAGIAAFALGLIALLDVLNFARDHHPAGVTEQLAVNDMAEAHYRGLLVTRFHYTNPVHSKRVVITGMTRDGTFLVEQGRIVGPVRNLRFTMSYLDALANVEAISRERRCLRGFMGGTVVPAVRLSSFSFTGATAAE